MDFLFVTCADTVQYDSAKNAYLRVLDRDPKHAKVLQQLGWLHHQESDSFQSQEQGIEYLEQSVSSGELTSPLPTAGAKTRRQWRCPELVPSGSMLHGAAKIPQGLRSLPTSGLPRWTEPDFLVLDRSSLLPDQPVPRRARCVFPCHPSEPVYL